VAEQEKFQFTWNGGEIGPNSLGRHDIDRWQSSAEVVRNWIARAEGGADNRPGTHIVGQEWLQMVDQAEITFTSTTMSNPIVITFSGGPLNLTDGDLVSITSITSGSTYELQGFEGALLQKSASEIYLTNYDSTDDALSVSGTMQLVRSSVEHRCIEFEFSTLDTYALYFGDKYMSVARNGALVLESTSYTVDGAAATAGERMYTTVSDGPTPYFSGDDVTYDDDTPDITNVPRDHKNKPYRIEMELNGTDDALTNQTAGILKTILKAVAHPYATGDLVLITSMTGTMGDLLNNREFELEKIDADTFFIIDRFGNYVDTRGTSHGAADGLLFGKHRDKWHNYASGGNSTGQVFSGNVTRYYKAETPWSASDVANLDYAQTADTMTFTCPGFVQRKLTRTGHDAWSFTVTDFLPSIDPPTDVTAFVSIPATRQVQITAISKATGEESLPMRKYIGGSALNTLTWDEVVGAFEYNVYHTPLAFYSPGFDVVSAGQSAVINTSVTETPDQSTRPPTIQNPFFVEGTPLSPNFIMDQRPIQVEFAGDHGLVTGDFVLMGGFTEAGGQVELNNRIFRITTISDLIFTLDNSDNLGYADSWSADGTVTPLVASDNPTAVAYFQQRLILANTPLHPQAIYMTASTSYDSMNTSVPPVDTDSVVLEIADIKVNAIKWLVPMQQLIALTAGGVFALAGDESGILTPTSHTPVPQYGGGVGNVKPVKYGESVIYVSDQGNQIFELLASSDFNTAKSYIPGEVSILAQHLFKDHAIKDMAGSRSPYPVIWFTRNDGILLGLTYVREHEVFAWHRHDTKHGNYESICTISEGRYNGIYTSVKRTLNGGTKRYFERFDDRSAVDIQDAFFVDCGVTFDDQGALMTHLEHYDPLRFYYTAASGSLDSVVVGDFIDFTHKIRGDDGIVSGALDGVRLQIKTLASDAVYGTYMEMESMDPAVDYDGEADFAGIDTVELVGHHCVTTIVGADHLEGVECAFLADGAELGRNDILPGGRFTFDEPHSRIHIGIPIQADLKTLPPDAVGGPFQSLHSTRIKTQDANLLLDRTLGIKLGPNMDSLAEQKWRTDEPYGIPTRPYTGLKRLNIGRDWDRGQVVIRQDAPLPATVLSIGVKIEGET
jgi:hypothetical protein